MATSKSDFSPPQAGEAAGRNRLENLRRDRTKASDAPKWVDENTAILAIHGIGNQLPMETLEQFGKTLVQSYQELFGDVHFTVEHRLEPKPKDFGTGEWFDNVLRIRRRGEAACIDLYEYYWAHYTENSADWDDIRDWISGVCSAGKKYYRRNTDLARQIGEDGNIVNSNPVGYFGLLYVLGNLIVGFNFFRKWLTGLLSRIPLLGLLVSNQIESFSRSTGSIVVNILADLVAYMVTDAKSKYFPIRRNILDSGVKALTYLLEKGHLDKDGQLIVDSRNKPVRAYPRVLVAGHSLGSQVGYDVINRVNLMVNNCQLNSYDSKGVCRTHAPQCVKDQLRGFITFGSPLDKTAFFLREQIPDDQFVRQQLLNDFHNFKQKDWTEHSLLQPGFFKVINDASPERLLEDVPWRNYFDDGDMVSGDLDYYTGLTNVNCRYKSGFWARFSFTHSYYWTDKDFYKDIIHHFLGPGKRLCPS